MLEGSRHLHVKAEALRGDTRIRVPTVSVPSLQIDIAQHESGRSAASPEHWAGPLSARGLDALQAIREAADRNLSLHQGFQSSVTGAEEDEQSSVSPRSPTVKRSRSPQFCGSPKTSPRPSLDRDKTSKEHLATSILPPSPRNFRGLPARSLRFQTKTADPPLPMHDSPQTRPISPRGKRTPGRRHLGGFVHVPTLLPATSDDVQVARDTGHRADCHKTSYPLQELQLRQAQLQHLMNQTVMEPFSLVCGICCKVCVFHVVLWPQNTGILTHRV